MDSLHQIGSISMDRPTMKKESVETPQDSAVKGKIQPSKRPSFCSMGKKLMQRLRRVDSSASTLERTKSSDVTINTSRTASAATPASALGSGNLHQISTDNTSPASGQATMATMQQLQEFARQLQSQYEAAFNHRFQAAENALEQRMEAAEVSLSHRMRDHERNLLQHEDDALATQLLAGQQHGNALLQLIQTAVPQYRDALLQSTETMTERRHLIRLRLQEINGEDEQIIQEELEEESL